MSGCTVGDRVGVLFEGKLYAAAVICVHAIEGACDVVYEIDNSVGVFLNVKKHGLKLLPYIKLEADLEEAIGAARQAGDESGNADTEDHQELLVETRKVCSAVGCSTFANVKEDMRPKHEAVAKCNVVGITTSAQARGFCAKHGAKDRCSAQGCNAKAKARGLCFIHGSEHTPSEINRLRARNVCKVKQEYKSDCSGRKGGPEASSSVRADLNMGRKVGSDVALSANCKDEFDRTKCSFVNSNVLSDGNSSEGRQALLGRPPFKKSILSMSTTYSSDSDSEGVRAHAGSDSDSEGVHAYAGSSWSAGTSSPYCDRSHQPSWPTSSGDASQFNLAAKLPSAMGLPVPLTWGVFSTKDIIVPNEGIVRKDGVFENWVLELGVKERNKIAKLAGLSSEEKKKLVKIAREYKQAVCHLRYRKKKNKDADRAFDLNSHLSSE